MRSYRKNQSEKSGKINVGILMINFESHSQNNIYVQLATYLPRDIFAVSVVGVVGDSGRELEGKNSEIVQKLSRRFVPISAFDFDLVKANSREEMNLVNTLDQFDVVMIANSNDDSLMLRFFKLAKKANVPVVLDLPNISVDDKIVELDVVERLIAPSHYVKASVDTSQLAVRAGSLSGVDVIYPVAVESEIDDNLGLGSRAQNIRRVGYLGRLSPERSPGLFIHLARYLISEEPSVSWEFVVAGTGSLHGCLVELAGRFGVIDRMRFIGSLEKGE